MPVNVFSIPWQLDVLPPEIFPTNEKALGDALANETQVEDPATTLVLINTPLLGLKTPPPPIPVAPIVLIDSTWILVSTKTVNPEAKTSSAAVGADGDQTVASDQTPFLVALMFAIILI